MFPLNFQLHVTTDEGRWEYGLLLLEAENGWTVSLPEFAAHDNWMRNSRLAQRVFRDRPGMVTVFLPGTRPCHIFTRRTT